MYHILDMDSRATGAFVIAHRTIGKSYAACFSVITGHFDRQAQTAAKFGKVDFGRRSGEPCQLLLEKIDRMKEQRINQTAHLILAEALGLRLREHEITPQEREDRDIHGEYEKIPGREPVDFIVIENLDRYLTSQGRGPSENSRLMKWAHRAVREKIKMLAEEPFGIPVVEAAAAYSSRFCAITGVAGARCEERAKLDDYLKELFEKRAKRPPKFGQPHPDVFTTFLNQFNELEILNGELKNGNNDEREKEQRRFIHSFCQNRVARYFFLCVKKNQKRSASFPNKRTLTRPLILAYVPSPPRMLLTFCTR